MIKGHAVRQSLFYLAGAALLIATLLGIGRLKYGSLTRAWATLRGQQLFMMPTMVDLGSAPTGETRTARFQIDNTAGIAVTIVGLKANCGCATSTGLPITIEPDTSKEVGVAIKFTGKEAAFSRSILFYSDLAAQPYLRADVSGRMQAAPAAESPQSQAKP